MNLTYFHPKSIENLGKRRQLSQHQICCQNIGHKKFLSKHQKQGCQVVISKKGQINALKKPNSTERSQIQDKCTRMTPLKHIERAFKRQL